MIAAAVQFFATPFGLDLNLETAERLVREAAGRGARVAVLPECFNTGYVYSPRLFESAEPPGGPTLQWMFRLSRELGILLAGSLLLREGNRVFNTLALIEPNGRAHCYRKRRLFLWERGYFEPGNSPLIAETALGRIALMVCWDLAHRDVWEAYRGKADLVLIASSPPRFHRAVLNFPMGKRLYLAELVPAFLRERERFDRWYFEDVAARAAWAGLPAVHAVMAGRFVTQVPHARMSFAAGLPVRPRDWRLAGQAHLASLRATFFGTSAVFSATGETLARVEGEVGIALAETGPARQPPVDAPFPPMRLPWQVRLLEQLVLARGAMDYRARAKDRGRR